MFIEISDKIDVNDIACKRFILTQKNNHQQYSFEAVNKEEWTRRFLSKQEAEVFNLGKITKIFNEVPCSGDAFDQVRARLTAAVKKHNGSCVQHLKYLFIPWIVAKIFGWTCMVTYDEPQDPWNLDSKESKKINPGVTLQENANGDIYYYAQDKNLTAAQLLDPGSKRYKRIKIMKLGCNSLTNLPQWFSKLTELEELVLRDNPFSKIPDEIFKLKKLTNLDFSGTKYANSPTELKWDPQTDPQKFKVFSRLKVLNLADNGVEIEKNQLQKHLPKSCSISDNF